jgi:hypothetical protein
MVRVECYAGYKADERPVRFHIGEREYTVERIVERWTKPGGNGFRVSTAEGEFILEQNRNDGSWTARPWRTRTS